VQRDHSISQPFDQLNHAIVVAIVVVVVIVIIAIVTSERAFDVIQAH
jgi:hypothetical protein